MKPSDSIIIVKRIPNIKERCIQDEYLLMDEVAGIIFNLNSLGAAIWRLLENPTANDEIAQVLAVAFPEITQGQIQEDVEALLRQLEGKGLISFEVEE